MKSKKIVFLIILLSIMFLFNTLAMQQLLSHTKVSLDANFYSFAGIYLNPFSFLSLYFAYEAIRPDLFKLPLLTYFGGFIVAIIAMFVIQQISGKKELTSEGTAKWATEKELKKKKLLVPVSKTDDATGIIVGTWYTGINHEKAHQIATWFKKKLHLKESTFWKLLQILEIFSSRCYIVDNAKTHAIMCAPSRSGKGVGVVIPTLLFWKDSMIVSDLKRENIRETGAYRKYILGHNVLEFAPTDTRPTARFNPLNEIRWGTPNEGKDVENIVTLLVGTPEGKDAHWKSNAISIIVGAVTYLKYKHAKYNADHEYKPKDKGYVETSMYHVYEFLTVSLNEHKEPITFKEKLEEIILKENQFPCKMYVHNQTSDLPFLLLHITTEKAKSITTFSVEALKTPQKHPVVMSRFSSFISKPDTEGGSILSTAITALSIFAEKIIADNTCTSDFIIGDIRGLSKPTDLFLVVPPSDLGRVDKLFKLVFEFIIQKSTEDEAKASKQRRCLLLIDEWPAFGKMDTLVKELGFIASYGLKTLLIVQGLDQVKKIYESMNFLTNCETQIYFAPRDDITPKFLSEQLGKKTILVKQESSGGGIFSRKNYTYLEKGRFLLDAAEVRKLGNESAMIIESMAVKSPKNKWFINKDLVDKLELGKSLDVDKKIGYREQDVRELTIMDQIRWGTVHELDQYNDTGEVAKYSDIKDCIHTLAPAVKNPILEEFFVHIMRLMYMKYDTNNYHNKKDKNGMERLILSMHVIYETLADDEGLEKHQKWLKNDFKGYFEIVLGIKDYVPSKEYTQVLDQYFLTEKYFMSMNPKEYEVLAKQALETIAIFKSKGDD